MGEADWPIVAFSSGTAPPKLAVPNNSCDCHMHVFDDAQAVLAGGLPKPPSASLPQYAGLQKRLGVTRFVNVTPSLYGTNNDVLIRSLRQAGDHGRGVAVVDNAVSQSTLMELHDAGVRGIRFNLVQSGTTTPSMLQPLARKIAPLGWHVQVHALPSLLLELESILTSLAVPVVLDHIASIGDGPVSRSVKESCLMRLLDTGKVWLKLSGPYFSARDKFSRDQLSEVASRLIDRYAERLLWGSDWPHGTEIIKPDDALMMDFFAWQCIMRHSSSNLGRKSGNRL